MGFKKRPPKRKRRQPEREPINRGAKLIDEGACSKCGGDIYWGYGCERCAGGIWTGAL
jgi:hypothetical protein